MKKLLKLAAVFAALAFMFGLASCSDSDDDDDTPTSQPGGDNGGSGNEGDGNGDGGEYTGEPTTDSWDFVNNETVFTLITGETKTTASDGVTYSLSEAKSVQGSEGKLTLTLQNDKVAVGSMTSGAIPVYAVQTAATDTTSKGLRIKNNALKISGVKGKVVLAFDYTAAGDSSRNLEVTVGNSETKTETTTDKEKHKYETEFDAGNGTDIYIGASNNYWIEKIAITKQAAEFTPATNDDTANDLATLGLVGTTVTSSDESIAKAAIADGKIKITSVKAGAATVTVKNAAGKEATIAVTVKSSGEIDLGTVTKFSREAPKLVEKTNANSSDGTKGGAKATWDELTALEYSQDGENFVDATTAGIAATDDGTTVTVTGLDAGTYYVRGAASEQYEATGVLEVVIGDDGAAKTTDSWTIADINDFTKLITKATIESDIQVTGASGNIGLTASAKGTGVGTTKMGNTPSSYQYVANKGLLIKKDALKIAGVKGTVKLTIEWYCNSDEASKSEEQRRKLEVTVGETGETKTQTVNIVPDSTKTQGKMDNFVLDVDGGTDGVDVYIGASNELYIQKITIE